MGSWGMTRSLPGEEGGATVQEQQGEGAGEHKQALRGAPCVAWDAVKADVETELSLDRQAEADHGAHLKVGAVFRGESR